MMGCFPLPNFVLIVLLLMSSGTLRCEENKIHRKPRRACPPCSCGLQKPWNLKNIRILGGHETSIIKHPWIVGLATRNQKIFCGGTIISDLHILTAAHCVRDGIIYVLFPRNSFINDIEIRRRVVQIKVHPSYGFPTMANNDIAILTMDLPLILGDLEVPACLPMPESVHDGLIGTIVGWGATTPSSDTSNYLMEAHVPILSQNDCRSLPGYRQDITEEMMCAGYLQGGTDACKGDSGGPLLITDKITGRITISGIVSWGRGCGLPMHPGVYTRVNYFLPWIIQHTTDGCFCL